MSVQQAFFDLLRSALPPDRPNLAQEVASVLHLSETSAYRRISGHTQLSVDEMSKLSQHFHIHPEYLFDHHVSRNVRFQWQYDNSTETSYQTFLRWLEDHLRAIDTHNCKAIFHAKDFPVFFNFIFPEIAAFKSFFWNKTFFALPAYRQRKFAFSQITDDIRRRGFNIFRSYAAIESQELWNDDIINSVLQQVHYCHEAGYMHNEDETVTLLKSLTSLVNHFQKMAEHGCKFLPFEEPEGGKLELYHNKVILGDNMLLLEESDRRTIYLSHNIVETLITHDTAFFANAYAIKQNLIKHSMLLSNSSEQERSQYFDRLRQKIDATQKALKL